MRSKRSKGRDVCKADMARPAVHVRLCKEAALAPARRMKQHVPCVAARTHCLCRVLDSAEQRGVASCRQSGNTPYYGPTTQKAQQLLAGQAMRLQQLQAMVLVGVQCIDVSRRTLNVSSSMYTTAICAADDSLFTVHLVVVASSCSSSAASLLYCAPQHGYAPCSLLDVGQSQSTLVTMLLVSYLCCPWHAASVAAESCPLGTAEALPGG